MASKLSLLLLLAVCLLLSTQILPSAAVLRPKCYGNHYPKLCLAVLDSKNESRDGHSTAYAPAAINYVAKFAVQAAIHISKMRNFNFDPDVHLSNIVSHCLTNYTQAVDHLIDAQYAVAIRDGRQATLWIKAVRAEVNSCKKFTVRIKHGHDDIKNYLEITNKEFFKLLRVAESFFGVQLD